MILYAHNNIKQGSRRRREESKSHKMRWNVCYFTSSIEENQNDINKINELFVCEAFIGHI